MGIGALVRIDRSCAGLSAELLKFGSGESVIDSMDGGGEAA